jgi:hypothetical protein
VSAASSSTARNDRFYVLIVSAAAVLTLSDSEQLVAEAIGQVAGAL